MIAYAYRIPFVPLSSGAELITASCSMTDEFQVSGQLGHVLDAKCGTGGSTLTGVEKQPSHLPHKQEIAGANPAAST